MARIGLRGALAGVLLMLLLAASAGATDVSPAQSTLSFGQGVAGSGASATHSLLYFNDSASPVQLSSVTSSPFLNDLQFVSSTCPGAFATTSVAPGGSCGLTIQYTPTVLGAESFTLTGGFCHPSGGTCTAATTTGVTVSAAGVSPDTIGLSSSALTFPATPKSGASPLQTVTLTNGLMPATIAQLLPAGPQAADFDVSRDTCSDNDLDPGATCTFAVRFLPDAPGTASASIAIAPTALGASPSSLALSGTGSDATTGPAGPGGGTGATGPLGPAGAKGLPGAAGQVELVSCRTVTVKSSGHRGRVKHRRCTTKLVSGKVKFTTAARGRATLARGRQIYATGTATPHRAILSSVRPLAAGRYTLRVRSGAQTRAVPVRIR